jgi:1-acyl-sn-glycerol-3-phosphate acyltransferase
VSTDQISDNYAGPPRGLLNHLHFAWVILWAGLSSIPCAIAQIVGHLFDPTARNFRRWGGAWAHITLKMSGYRVSVERSANLDAHVPYVYVSNHQTGLDIWTHLVGIPGPFGFVAKAELKRIPFIGIALRFSASLFVDRSTPRKAVASMREAAERIRNGNSVLIYPEGRRTWSPEVDPFLKGAFQLAVEAGVPIVPTALINTYRLYDERFKSSKPGVVRLVIGSPIETEGLNRANIPELMERVKDFIESEIRASGMPPSDPAGR